MPTSATPGPSADVRQQHTGVHTDFQSINADYYNLTDAQGWPIAGLLVLLDRKQRAVRAELHLYSDTAGQLEEMAVRQAMNLMADRYHTAAPPGTRDARLDLRVMRTYQERDTVQVGLLPAPAGSQGQGKPYLLWGVVAAGILLLVMALLWLGSTLFGAKDVALPATLPTQTPVVQVQDAAAQPAPADAANSQSAAQPSTNTPIPPQTNGLPSSVNALDLRLGQRVRIRPGLTLTLRSQPGAEAGEGVGFMQDGQPATLVGGPVWMPGLSDTIVWWYVRLDNGQEAWASANTSEFTLLEPVP